MAGPVMLRPVLHQFAVRCENVGYVRLVRHLLIAEGVPARGGNRAVVISTVQGIELDVGIFRSGSNIVRKGDKAARRRSQELHGAAQLQF